MNKEQLAAQAARVNRPRPERNESTAVQSRPATPPRTKPVRVTADLAPQSYRGLVAFCTDLAGQLGRAKVPLVEVIRALVDQLDDDPQLRSQITALIQQRTDE